MSEPRTVTSGDLQELRDKLQPHYKGNVDPMLFTYAYWTETERIAKRERASAIQVLESEYAPPSDEPDTSRKLVAGKALELHLTVSKPRVGFSKDRFIDEVAKQFDIPKHSLIELAEECVVEGTRSRSFKVHTVGSL